MKKTSPGILSVILAVLMLLPGLTACSANDSSDSAPADSEPVGTGTITVASEDSNVDSDSLQALAIRFAGKSIGVQIGTVFDAVINQYIPEATVEYYNSNADMALALKTGKISAYIADEPMARLLCQTYTDQYITGIFEECPYAYVYPKGTEKTAVIRAQMNEFLAKIKADGTIRSIDAIWFGDDESQKVVDTSDLTGENGTLEFSMISAVGAPFVYVKDNSYVGYDVDIAVRFCREYGYGIHITDSNVGGFFAGIASGLIDFGASSICVTEERKEEMDFSDPNYEGSVVLVTREYEETDVSEISDTSQFAVLKGKNIGVIKDSVGDDILDRLIPSANIVEMETLDDLTAALEADKIDAYFDDQPLVRHALSIYPNHHVLGVVEKADYAFLFRKDDQKADKLRTEMNEFLQQISADGTLEEIDGIWFGEDEDIKEIDYSDLTGNNGTVRIAVCTTVGEPFVYYHHGGFCGYEADIAYRFCKAYGYELEFVDTNFSDIFSLISSGECDMGASCITVTEERRETFNFSDTEYNGGTVIVIKKEDEFDLSKISASSAFDGLKGKKIGCLSGGIMKAAAEASINSPNIVEFASSTELGKALENGTVDAYITDQPIARILVKAYEDHHVHSVVAINEYGYVFQKNNSNYPQLREQMNSFIKNLKADGTLDEIDAAWFGDNTTLQTVDMSKLTGENGTLRMAVSSYIGAPFCCKDGSSYLGYDIDIAVRFCENYGYSLEIIDFDSTQSILEAIGSGKYDFGGSCITITEERRQTVDFSAPNYYGGIVIITKGTREESESDILVFIKSVANSFRKTFIREERWKMFASGLGVTVLITVISAIVGSLLGFLLFLLYRKRKRAINTVIDRISEFLQMTPAVVILMIFYYLLFAKAGFSGITVSVIAFSLMFACSVKSLFSTAVKAVDIGQTLAVRAMGYKDTKGFMRMILPQTIPYFVPGYKGELVALIKSTSIVSYVAVQDLTMVTDIIRSRTYEAFFPLAVTAAIYFSMALLLTKLIGRIEINLDPCSRKESRILKGVKTND